MSRRTAARSPPVSMDFSITIRSAGCSCTRRVCSHAIVIASTASRGRRWRYRTSSSIRGWVRCARPRLLRLPDALQPRGANQAWKDSSDAIIDEDGSQVETPIATCTNKASCIWPSCVCRAVGRRPEKFAAGKVDVRRSPPRAWREPKSDYSG